MCIIPELLAPDVHEPRIAFVGLSTSQITAGMLAGFLLQLSYFGTYLHGLCRSLQRLFSTTSINQPSKASCHVISVLHSAHQALTPRGGSEKLHLPEAVLDSLASKLPDGLEVCLIGC
ncbi:hypothetical protein ABBQ32_007129 [Trebouxia sp. C0010 RCD-2024]